MAMIIAFLQIVNNWDCFGNLLKMILFLLKAHGMSDNCCVLFSGWVNCAPGTNINGKTLNDLVELESTCFYLLS
jgi:hypothetical protein